MFASSYPIWILDELSFQHPYLSFLILPIALFPNVIYNIWSLFQVSKVCCCNLINYYLFFGQLLLILLPVCLFSALLCAYSAYCMINCLHSSLLFLLFVCLFVTMLPVKEPPEGSYSILQRAHVGTKLLYFLQVAGPFHIQACN